MFLVKFFSKNLRGVERSSTALKGCGGRWCPVGTVQDRSTLPLRSVLGVCHWQTAPEAAAETSHRLPILPKKGGTDVPPFFLLPGSPAGLPRPLPGPVLDLL